MTPRRFASLVAIVFALSLSTAAPVKVAALADHVDVPILAYYYIWFDEGSWDRAKTDLPLLGAYSSSDRAVMEEHVRLAKMAGIDGFVVSWKQTPVLDERLTTLIDVARKQAFKLAIIYQGLDFSRSPLPVDRVAEDLERFSESRGADPVFDILGQPLVIWSGTWEFTTTEVEDVAERVRPAITLLASEKDVAGFKRLGAAVDGNAYYWSSVDPTVFPSYEDRLAEMGRAVHSRGGLWIAPAAPGFDARQIGGTRVVPRAGGETLRLELSAALASQPDAVGLISWNEFSENSHVEPSKTYGYTALKVVADVQGATLTIESSDSDGEVVTTEGPPLDRVAALGLTAFLILGATLVLLRRWLAAGS